MTCDCIDNIDKQLRDQGQRLGYDICFRGNNLVGTTTTPILRGDTGRKENRRSKPSIMAHKFCPFCGVQYEGVPA
jgi:hypothetical protein